MVYFRLRLFSYWRLQLQIICRSNARGRGIAIYVQDDLLYDVLADIKVINDNYECITVKFYGISFALFCRPPSGVLSNFLDFSEKVLQLSIKLNLESVLVGDFNINASSENPSYLRFQEIFQSYGCFNATDEPTRITPTCQTILDLFLTSLLPDDVRAGVILYDLSDHLPRYLLLPCSLPRKSKQYNLMRHYLAKNISKFESSISAEVWDGVFNETDANSAYNASRSCFMSAYNTCFPLKPQEKKT